MKMKLKIIVVVSLTTSLLFGCSNEEKDKAVDEPKKEQVNQKEKQKHKQNKELTKKITDEKGVIGGQVYEQVDTAIGTLLLEEKVSDKEAKALAEKYVKEIQKEYKGKKINVQAVRDGKNVANITKD